MSGEHYFDRLPERSDCSMTAALALHPKCWSEATTRYGVDLVEDMGPINTLTANECVTMLDDVERKGADMLRRVDEWIAEPTLTPVHSVDRRR
jgi:hypothetical protein